VEYNLLSHVRCFNTTNSSNVFKNNKTEWHIFPEETSVRVKNNFGWVCGVLGYHWERYSGVAQVCVKNSFQRRFVADLPIVHDTNALGEWDNVRQVKILKFRYENVFDFLNFIIKKLNFICTVIIQVFIKFWHF